jgi:hypothetical protein
MAKKDTDVADDVTDDATDDNVTDDATDDDVTDDSTDDTDADDVTDDDQGGKKDGDQDGKSKPKPSARQSKDDSDPAAGLKTALQKERAARRAADKELKDLRLKHASAEERQLLEAREQAAAEASSATRGPLVKALAVAKLEAAGVQTGTAKLVGLLDLTKVELDDDGEIIGLGEQIDELKTDFPNLFAAAGGAVRPGNVNGGSGNGRKQDKQGKQEPKGFAQQLADQVMGAVPPGQGMVSR